MAKASHIVVREFEYLTKGAHDRAGCHALSAAQFDALREFILENSGSGDDPLELMRLCALPKIGEAIQLRNYVGVIELDDDLQIEVLPKIEMSAGSNVDDRDLFLKMLSALGGDISFRSLETSHLSSDRLPLMEVFISMFLSECSTLVRSGLKSAYSQVSDTQSVVRGRINFALQARSNPVHAERLHVEYDELLLDRPENRLIKSALRLLSSATKDGTNSRTITRLLPSFEGVCESTDVDADLSLCTYGRDTKGYVNLIAWCRVFLKGESFTAFKGSHVATALLFPMEQIFEDYVGKELRREAIKSRRMQRVDLQAQTEWLFDSRRVRLRPDILATCKNGRSVVLDTKWKRVAGPRDLSVADMHQMYAYGKRYGCDDEHNQHVILLFPWNASVPAGLLPAGRHVSPDGVQVDMFFVDLANMRQTVSDLLDLIEDPSALEG